MAVVYGDYRTCMLGALKKMGIEPIKPVLLKVARDMGCYAYGYMEDWVEGPVDPVPHDWVVIFNMDAGDAIHLMSCRYQDLFEVVENASDSDTVQAG